MVYPPWESLALVSPRPNFPAEDKPHNLRVNVLDPILPGNDINCQWEAFRDNFCDHFQLRKSRLDTTSN